MAKRKRNNNSNNNRQRALTYSQQVARYRSVRPAAIAISNIPNRPSSSGTWMRTLLDPAHAIEYASTGIPDDNIVPTLVSNFTTTFMLNPTPGFSNWIRVDNASELTVDQYTITKYYLYATGDASNSYLQVCYANVRNPEDNRYYDAYHVERKQMPDVVAWTGTDEYRVLAKSITVDQVGQRMYRGGYYTTHKVSDQLHYATGTNSTSVELDTTKWESSTVGTFSDKQGVYAVLQMTNKSNYTQFRVRDDSGTQLVVRTAGGAKSISSDGWDSKMDLMAFAPVLIGYIPPQAVRVTSGDDPIISFSLRVTTHVTIERKTPTANGGKNGATSDSVTMNIASAINEYHIGYYPASYNDMKRVWGAIKRTYAKHQDVIHAVAGMIPYGENVVNMLDALLDPDTAHSKASTKRKAAAKRVADALVASA